MLISNRFLLALAFLGSSAATQAAESGNELPRMPLTKSSDRIDRFDDNGVQHPGTVWGQGLSERSDEQPHADRLYYSTAYESLSGTYKGMPVAQQALSGHYDVQQAAPLVTSAQDVDSPSWKPFFQKI